MKRNNWMPVVASFIKILNDNGVHVIRVDDGGECITIACDDECHDATAAICSVDESQVKVQLPGGCCAWMNIVLGNEPSELVQDYSQDPLIDRCCDEFSTEWEGKECPTEDTGPTMPTVHMNGTGIKTLRETYDNAARTLQDFIQAWGNTEFNSRDYYMVEGSWDKAVAEREEMNAKIREVRDYLQSIREHLHS